MGDGLSGRPGAGAFLLDEDMRVTTGVSLLTPIAFTSWARFVTVQ